MKIRFLLAASVIIYTISFAQPIHQKNSAEIKLALEKLQVLGSVLYVAAHPDDENTAVLSYFSLHKKLRTGYLSLTRGDGGQNLIGPEKGDLIGVIRAGELLEARKIDRVDQFFTRAIDFGYTKSEKETIQFWGEENIVSDIVYVIRKFRPDVIITRFPPEGIQTHGQHIASASLAVKAFNMAGDPEAYTGQLDKVKPWQAKRIVWDSWLPYYEESEVDLKDFVTEDVGEYNKLLGKSYLEIRGESRSKHRSQGFGARGYRGSYPAYFKLLEGDSARTDLFSGIDISWERIQGTEAISNKILELNQNYDSADPSKSIDGLLDLYQELSKMPQSLWVEVKREEVKQLIKDCSGIWFEATAEDYSYSFHDSVKINMEVTNRSDFGIYLSSIKLPYNEAIIKNTELPYNENVEITDTITIPGSADISQPFWLKKPHNGLIFSVENFEERVASKRNSGLTINFNLRFGDVELVYETPLYYRWVDRVSGEHYRLVEIRPPVTANLENGVYIYPNNDSRNIDVRLKGFSDNITGNLRATVNDGWNITPQKIDFALGEKYAEENYKFSVSPPEDFGSANVVIITEVNGKEFSKSIFEIDYEHLPRQTVLSVSEAKLVKLDISTYGDKIGYIEGAGDEIPKALQVLGYDVVMLSDDDIEALPLADFDAIITGIRAYNTRDRIAFYNDKLLDYVYNGGNLIVQYNVSFGLQTEKIGPYDFTISRDRVTRENAEVTILDPDHVLLNYPNKITSNDFKGWVQERGLYFPNEWAEEYETIISCFDPGEDPKEGGLIYAEYGKGSFIYTGYSWFRQLPAGVPGAYRIFANLIAGGKRNE